MSDIEFHTVAKTADLDDGEARQVVIGGREIAIFNLQGNFFATDDICTHAYASLADGYVEGERVECPLHGGCFDIKTGKAVTAPCLSRGRSFMPHTALSAKSSSTLAKPVTVFPLARYSPPLVFA